MSDGLYPVMNSGRDFYGWYDSKNNSGNAITIAARGNAGYVNYIERDFWAGGLCYPYRSANEDYALTKYVYYVLKNDEQHMMDFLVARGSIPAINKKDLDKFRIPIPPIEVQREIVRILDSFQELDDALTTEIKAREQQLAAVRDWMLGDHLKELCPNGVEYKTLGEVGVFIRGSSFQKKHFVEDGVPCIHYGQVHTRFNIATDEVVSYLNEGFSAKMKRAQPGDLIIATTSEDDDAVGKAIAWVGDTDVVVSNDAYIYRHKLNPKYMAYVFASDLFQKSKRQYITGTKVRRLNDKDMSKIVIPVPPIDEQQAIADKLDEMLGLIDVMKAERDARRKQFEYYRDKLLSFPEREV